MSRRRLVRPRASWLALEVLAALLLIAAGVLGQQQLRSKTTSVESSAPSVNETVLWNAEQLLTQQCMEKAGFEYWPENEMPIPDVKVFPYVIDDLAWATRHGYGSDIDAAETAAAASDPNSTYFRALPADRQRAATDALNGTGAPDIQVRLPNGPTLATRSVSCSNQARQQLYGDAREWFVVENTVRSLDELRRTAVVGDTAYLAAEQRWSACMDRNGHSYATPTALRQDLAAIQGRGRSFEISVASSEARCGQQSGLTAESKALDDFYRRQLDVKYQQSVVRKARLQASAMARALRVTSKG